MFNKRKIDDKLVKKSVVFLSSLILLFCLVVFVDNNIVRYVAGDYDTNPSIEWSIDKVDENLLYYNITGLALIPRQDNKPFAIQILLKNSKTNTFMEINTDMRAGFLYTDPSDNYSYRDTGFIATVNKYLLDKNVDYEICILFSHKGKKNIVFTNNMISM